MRILLAALIWVILIGGVFLYMQQRQVADPVREYIREKASGTYAIDVTASFTIAPDPFALQEEGKESTALLLRLDGKEILRRTDKLAAGSIVVIDPVPGLVVGRNEFYIEVNPPLDQANRSHAVRVRILRDRDPLVERTFWSEPGIKLVETFTLHIEDTEAEEHPHDH